MTTSRKPPSGRPTGDGCTGNGIPGSEYHRQLAALIATRALVHGLLTHHEPPIEPEAVMLALLDQASGLARTTALDPDARLLATEYARQVYVDLARELPAEVKAMLDLETAGDLAG